MTEAVPPLRKLEYVVAVAHTLHFGKAASCLYVSQSALSRQVRDIEDHIGFRIFIRDGHHIRLTKAGQVFAKATSQALAAAEENFRDAVQRGRAVAHREHSADYLLAHSPFVPLKLRRVALRMRENLFKNGDLRLRVLGTTDLLRAVEDEAVDAGITFAPIHSSLSSISLGQDHWVAVVPKQGRYSNLKISCIGDLSSLPIISNGADLTHPALFASLNAEYEAKGLSYKSIAEVKSPQEAFDLVSSGEGVVIVPSGVCDVRQSDVRIASLRDLPPLEIVLVYRRDDHVFAEQIANRIREDLDREVMTQRRGPSRSLFPSNTTSERKAG